MFDVLLLEIDYTALVIAILGVAGPALAYIGKLIRDIKAGKEDTEYFQKATQAARTGAEGMACVLAHLILAERDGKITPEEYSRAVDMAQLKLIEAGRVLDMDLTEIINQAKALMEKAPAPKQ